MKKVAVIGAGSWGTTIANIVANNGVHTELWVRRTEQCAIIQNTGMNEQYLPGVKLSDRLLCTPDIISAVRQASIVILAVPSHVLRATLELFASVIERQAILVSAIKGIETDTLERMSEVIRDVFPGNSIAILSGPNIAGEIAAGLPAASLVACADESAARRVQDVLMAPNFRVYTAIDVLGVELGGALKNVMAIGAGLVEELALGDNLRATFITRGLAEMIRLGTAMGAQPQTFSGLSGLGDLIVTCISPRSRNFRAGRMFARGCSVEEVNRELKMVAEGIKTTYSARRLAEKYNVDMPLAHAAYRIIYERADARAILQELMTREKKAEAV